MADAGKLFVVATPIGNLGDLSPRARSTLESVSAIFCEDTRVTGKLAARFGLTAPRYSCHEHNEASRIGELLSRLGRGEDVAYVSDAGTPAISDPGRRLVDAAARSGFEVRIVPGPSAAVAALAVSGMAAVPHLFLGFPPARQGERRSFFQPLRDRAETLVFFEAPHRLAASLADAAEVLGERSAAVGRELTKLHEEVIRGTLGALAARLAARPVRGECVVVVEGAPAESSRPAATGDQIDAELATMETPGLSARERARAVAKKLGVPSREVYA
ncbi:MAG: 16S rRNA (cytidine(1402)-2'-O)-methyltransferase, partial [Thermoanaerobaculia bacterium]